MQQTPRGKKRRHRTRSGGGEGISKKGGGERGGKWRGTDTEPKLRLFRPSSTHTLARPCTPHHLAPHYPAALRATTDFPGSLRLQGLRPTPIPQETWPGEALGSQDRVPTSDLHADACRKQLPTSETTCDAEEQVSPPHWTSSCDVVQEALPHHPFNLLLPTVILLLITEHVLLCCAQSCLIL